MGVSIAVKTLRIEFETKSNCSKKTHMIWEIRYNALSIEYNNVSTLVRNGSTATFAAAPGSGPSKSAAGRHWNEQWCSPLLLLSNIYVGKGDVSSLSVNDNPFHHNIDVWRDCDHGKSIRTVLNDNISSGSVQNGIFV